MSLADLFRCICKEGSCKHRDSIKWNREDHITHILIDGCVIKSNLTQKCDCLLMYFPDDAAKTIMFFVEVKPKNYHLDEVKEQIEKSIVQIESLCAGIRNRVPIAVCYAKSHSSGHHRFIDSYKVSSSKGPLVIKLLNYGDNILKAIR